MYMFASKKSMIDREKKDDIESRVHRAKDDFLAICQIYLNLSICLSVLSMLSILSILIYPILCINLYTVIA